MIYKAPTSIKNQGANGGCSGLVIEYQTRNRKVAGLTHTRSTASDLAMDEASC